jgi:hypothetical protein
MAKKQVNYRLVLEAGNVQSVSEPASLHEILAAFNDQVARGAFRPTSRMRLLVLSDDAWASRRSIASSHGL